MTMMMTAVLPPIETIQVTENHIDQIRSARIISLINFKSHNSKVTREKLALISDCRRFSLSLLIRDQDREQNWF